MMRMLAQLVLAVLANAVGLLAASVLLEGFSIDAMSFVVVVLVFSATTTILSPLIFKIALTNASYLVGGIALVTTFVGFVVTDVLTDGLSINGLSTWVVATLVVWLASVVASLVLPLMMFKKVLGNNDSSRRKPRSRASIVDTTDDE